MVKPPAKVHYMPHNEKVWTPGTVAFIKTITAPIPGAVPEVLELVGWCATVILRRDVPQSKPDRRTGTGTTGAELAAWLIDATRGRDTCWVFTHNTGLDLVTTRLPLELHAAGWSINDASISGRAPWLRLAKGSRRFCIVDSFSWLPHTAADLAERLGRLIPKRGPDEPTTEWGRRSARADLDTVAGAMLTLLDWWDLHSLGRWTVSGPGCGWNAMRHIKTFGRVVIDPDPAGMSSDRAAIHGGRRGAWIVGTRNVGPFLELDFRNAYPSVAEHLPLPTQRTSAFGSMALDNWRLTSDRWGVIASVRLCTDVARWPVRFKGGTFCPTGQFVTTLAGPEIRDALRLGCVEAIGAGYVHQLGYHLQPWGQWILDVTHNEPGDIPVAAQLAGKNWSRTVIGKFAARSYERVPLGHSPELGWGYIEGWDHATQTRGAMVHLAGEQWWNGVDGDADNAYPAVFGWTESEVRVRLSRVIEAVGERAVLQCDTDGLIVIERLLGTKAARGHLLAPDDLTGAARTKWVIDQLDPIIAPLVVHIKRTLKSVRIMGPQHVRTDQGDTLAGIPGTATEVAKDKFEFQTWPKLTTQMTHGDPRGYVRPVATRRVRGPYAPGWVLTDGRVIPPQSAIRVDGTNKLLPWTATQNKPKGARLAQKQHPVLAALW